MVGATAVVGSLVAGARVVLRTVSLSPGLFVLLFSPLFGTVIQHGCWVRLLIGSLELFGWGSIPLLSARVPRVVGWVFPPCLADSRGDSYLFLVSAMFGRLSASSGWARHCWGVSVVVPVPLWLGRD